MKDKNVQMKGQIDMLITGIILVMIFTISSVILWTTLSTGGLRAGTLVLEEGMRQDVYSGSQSILYLKDPQTGKNMQQLLGDFAVYGKMVNYGPMKGVVNTEKAVARILDSYYGDRYQFIVEPIKGQIDLIFLLDTSTSLENERETLNAALPQIINQFRNAGFTIFSKIYILEGDDLGGESKENEWCSPFRANNITCESLGTKTIENSVSYGLLNAYDIKLHGPVGYKVNDIEYDQKEENWGDGSAYASLMGFASSNEKPMWHSSVRVVVPITNELSLGDEAESCSLIDTSTPGGRKNRTVCGYCETDCPVNRSMETVRRAIGVAQANDVMVCPIKTNPWANYSYFEDLYCCTHFNSISYCQNNATPEEWVCGYYSQCQGTGRNGDLYILKPMCKGELGSQLNMLAEQTGCGNFTELSDASEIYEKIRALVEEAVDKLNLKAGRNPVQLARVSAYSFAVPVPAEDNMYTVAKLYRW